jgi:hypothetical protein
LVASKVGQALNRVIFNLEDLPYRVLQILNQYPLCYQKHNQ